MAGDLCLCAGDGDAGWRWLGEVFGLMHIMFTFDMQIANDCVDHNRNVQVHKHVGLQAQ